MVGVLLRLVRFCNASGMEIQGGCYCGAVRYAVSGDPLFSLCDRCLAGRQRRDMAAGPGIDDVGDEVVRLVRPLDEDDARPALPQGAGEVAGDSVRVVPHREPVKRLGEHGIDLPGDFGRVGACGGS